MNKKVTVKRYIQNLLIRSFGYQLTKLYPPKRIKLIARKEPLYIDFFGVSGVGKSTLYAEVRRRNTNGGSWAEVKDFIGTLKDYSLPKQIDPVYQKILERKYQIINKDYELEELLEFMNFYFRNIKEDIIAHAYNENYTIVMEDGLVHNFADSIFDLHKEKQIDLSRLIKNRAVIYCYNTPEEIAKRIMSRQKEIDELRPQHRKISTDELIHEQQLELSKNREYIETLLDNGVPVLEVDTSDDVTENAGKVNRFIEELQH